MALDRPVHAPETADATTAQPSLYTSRWGPPSTAV